METWLDPHVSNNEVFPNNYCVYRADRKFSEVGMCKGGGSLIAVNNTNFKSTEIDLSYLGDIKKVDIVGCKIFASTCTHINVFCLYVPPNISVIEFELIFNLFGQFIASLNDRNKVFIVGDFNITKFNDLDYNNSKVSNIVNFMSLSTLIQCNNISNINNRLLDLCFIWELNVQVTRDYCPILQIDLHHPVLNFEVDIMHYKTTIFPFNSSNNSFNFKKANFTALYKEMSEVDWSFLRDINNNINDIC